ncbi:MAG: hypothetical protein AB7O43_02325 [Hyphomicrobiaceae bacterium]
MRYILAMIFAVVVALGVSVFVSGDVATWVVSHQSFESPDDVADRHALVFMAVNVVALLVGWGIGWVLGGVFHKPEQPL